MSEWLVRLFAAGVAEEAYKSGLKAGLTVALFALALGFVIGRTSKRDAQ